jgi:hypothetical protein
MKKTNLKWMLGVGVLVLLTTFSQVTQPVYGRVGANEGRQWQVNGPMQAGTPTPAPSVTLTTVPTTTTTADWRARLPRDEKGRIIGGENFPVINYSPTMITGKPCPRVTKWTFKIYKTKAGNFGISDDPCVVQNAVDDMVRTMYFSPAVHTPKTYKEIAKQAAIDPAFVNGVEVHRRTSLLENYYKGTTAYNKCDKPNFYLLNVDARTPITSNNDGTVTGNRMTITFLRATADVKPFRCDFVSYVGDTIRGKFEVTGAMISNKVPAEALGYDVFWNSQKQHWIVLKVDGIPFPKYADTVKALWAASPVKPQ